MVLISRRVLKRVDKKGNARKAVKLARVKRGKKRQHHTQRNGAWSTGYYDRNNVKRELDFHDFLPDPDV